MISIFINKVDKNDILMNIDDISTIGINGYRIDKPIYDLEFLLRTIEKSKKEVLIFMQDEDSLYRLILKGFLGLYNFNNKIYFYIIDKDTCTAF